MVWTTQAAGPPPKAWCLDKFSAQIRSKYSALKARSYNAKWVVVGVGATHEAVIRSIPAQRSAARFAAPPKYDNMPLTNITLHYCWHYCLDTSSSPLITIWKPHTASDTLMLSLPITFGINVCMLPLTIIVVISLLAVQRRTGSRWRGLLPHLGPPPGSRILLAAGRGALGRHRPIQNSQKKRRHQVTWHTRHPCKHTGCAIGDTLGFNL